MTHDMALARGDRLADLGQWGATYALAIIFLIFGAAKFGANAGESIAPLVMNSPFVSWWHSLFGVDGTALFVGVLEILTGLQIAARPFNPRLSMIGGAMAVATFLVTLSFLFSTPKVDAMLGEFLLKDLVLLAVAFWVFAASRAEARFSTRSRRADFVATVMTFDITGSIILAPKLGAAALIGLVVAGQLILSVLLDHTSAGSNSSSIPPDWRG